MSRLMSSKPNGPLSSSILSKKLIDMNERIRELAKQATIHSKEGFYTYTQIDAEKFAELIVRECIGCCEQVISDPVPESVDTWLNGGSQCIQEIKEHFGVE